MNRFGPTLVMNAIAVTWTRFVQLLRTVRADRFLLTIFALLLAIDLGWTFWYGFAKLLYNLEIDKRFYDIRFLRITTEHGLPELYSYAKTAVLVLLLGRLSEWRRQPVYVALTVLFAAILADDSLAIHEAGGAYFEQALKLNSWHGMRGQDVGELITWAILGAGLVPLLALGFACSDRDDRVGGSTLLVPFAALVVLAACLDQLYHIFKNSFFGAGILIDMVEDGGEMITITVACMLVAALMKQEPETLPTRASAPPVEATAVAAPAETVRSRRALLLGGLTFALLGIVVMMYLQAFELTTRSRYHSDLTQSPHWMAYHNDQFPKDDFLVEYGSFNESPVQNAMYWFGTLFIDVVPFNKAVVIGGFGLTAGLFFVLVTLMSTPQTGALAALLFLVFPRSAYEIGGGFSKAWAIGLVLVAVFVVERRAWQLLPFVMPFAALAYPMSAVLIGAIVFSGLGLEALQSRREALRGLKYLVAGSVLANIPLLYKYASPSPRIGKMIETELMRQKYETGVSHEVPLPLWQELMGYTEQPFFIYGLLALLILLGHRGCVWNRGWSALMLGSGTFYMIAEQVVPKLYLPDRYTRYSMAVLLVLWFAYNINRFIEPLQYKWLRSAAVVGIVVAAAYSFRDTFKPCDGKEALGCWDDKDRFQSVSAAIASEPSPVLVAGHPYPLSHVLVQSRRPVLLIHRMFHHWYDQYRNTINKRAIYTFNALYADNIAPVNQLATEYGVTHIIIQKGDYNPQLIRTGQIWRPEFAGAIAEIARGKTQFVLNPPPNSAVVFEDHYFWVVRLPLP